MRRSPTFALILVASIIIVSCGDDDPTGPDAEPQSVDEFLSSLPAVRATGRGRSGRLKTMSVSILFEDTCNPLSW
ncbi:hypothetical protein GF314_08775 [bacterium]|nr:hypothetical protein [bacterium]